MGRNINPVACDGKKKFGMGVKKKVQGPFLQISDEAKLPAQNKQRHNH